jgi:HSP90 family molecular chaperone
MDAKDVSPEMHDEFYRFVGTSYDRPRFTLHYKTDAPLTLRALLYFPEGKPGMQQEDAHDVLLSCQLFWDVMLCHGVCGSQHFKTVLWSQLEGC